MKKRDKGPIEILCKEIDFHFDKRLERTDLLVSFVTVLVAEVSRLRSVQGQISSMTGTEPSSNSLEALKLADEMLDQTSNEDMIYKASEIHDFVHIFEPDDKYPCDHLVDMVSSCASAIRFGLETPCKSRHAASAVDHIWKHVYGISLFDSFTSNWRNDWARAKLHDAILRLTPCT